jgi:hypothetical protein
VSIIASSIDAYTDRLRDLRRQLADQRKESARAREELASDPTPENSMSLARSLNAEAEQKAVIEDLEAGHKVDMRRRYSTNGGAGGISGELEASFTRDPGTLEELQSLVSSGTRFGEFNLGQFMSRDRLMTRFGSIARDDWRSGRMAADPTVSESALSRLGPYQGIVSQLRRELTLMDLIPTATMEGNSFIATTEGGSFAGAAETAELQLAPDADITLTDFTVYARRITAYFKCAREVLDDVPGLADTLDRRLIYGVQLRIENQLLNGDGTGENLLGILNTTGIGAPASGSGDTANMDLVANGIANVRASNAIPTGVVMNPHDAIAAAKAKASTSGLRLDSQGAFSSVLETAWGIPVVQTNAMTQGKCLVGDFFLGATAFMREGVGVRVSDADQDDFLRSRISMLGYCRLGFVVWRAACFALVNLTFPT